jgi:hypothetical protein
VRATVRIRSGQFAQTALLQDFPSGDRTRANPNEHRTLPSLPHDERKISRLLAVPRRSHVEDRALRSGRPARRSGDTVLSGPKHSPHLGSNSWSRSGFGEGCAVTASGRTAALPRACGIHLPIWGVTGQLCAWTARSGSPGRARPTGPRRSRVRKAPRCRARGHGASRQARRRRHPRAYACAQVRARQEAMLPHLAGDAASRCSYSATASSSSCSAARAEINGKCGLS